MEDKTETTETTETTFSTKNNKTIDFKSPEMQKLKKENYLQYRRIYCNFKTKNTPWFCDVCNNGKDYSIRGKWSHLGTKKHERNYYAANPLIKL